MNSSNNTMMKIGDFNSKQFPKGNQYIIDI